MELTWCPLRSVFESGNPRVAWIAGGQLWQELGGGTWKCKQCSEKVSEKEKATHEDFHVALEMSQQQAGAQHPFRA